MMTESDVCSTAALSRERSAASARSPVTSRATLTNPVMAASASWIGETEASTMRSVPSWR